jgi:hypothetical protein
MDPSYSVCLSVCLCPAIDGPGWTFTGRQRVGTRTRLDTHTARVLASTAHGTEHAQDQEQEGVARCQHTAGQ